MPGHLLTSCSALITCTASYIDFVVVFIFDLLRVTSLLYLMLIEAKYFYCMSLSTYY